MKLIPLTKGQTATVDDEDGDLADVAWWADKRDRTFYARRTVYGGGKRTNRYLHKVIATRMGIEGEVDHRDRDGLNCRRENLRPATRQQNTANHSIRRSNKSGTKGVSWYKRKGTWRVQVKINGKNNHLGYFDDIAEAAAVANAARERAFGEFA